MLKKRGTHGAGNGNSNGTPPLATADDFKAAADTYMEDAVAVVLPKLGKPVMLRRPHPMWFLIHSPDKGIPTPLADTLIKDDAGVGHSTADVAKGLQWSINLIIAVMVSPKASMTPGPGEISPTMIHEDDIIYIVKWATGQLGGAGEDLTTFRKQPEGFTSLSEPDRGNIP